MSTQMFFCSNISYQIIIIEYISITSQHSPTASILKHLIRSAQYDRTPTFKERLSKLYLKLPILNVRNVLLFVTQESVYSIL